MGRRITLARDLASAFGPRWLVFRAGYAARQRSGWMRHRWPAAPWDAFRAEDLLVDRSLSDPARYLAYRKSNPATFFFGGMLTPPMQEMLTTWGDGPERRAAELERGRLCAFSALTMETGFPPRWHENPLTGTSSPLHHWTGINEFGAEDIKLTWEASRFSFVYDLVRAYGRTGDERYARDFWTLVEDWLVENPPNQGVNWKCGQETSFRVMAWCFGLYGFLHATATTPVRVLALLRAITVSGERIAANLSYALSQRNNHGVSEATGLWTIGLLFPELRRAHDWRALGRRHLEALVRDLFYDDGTFVQHSTNYHRVALHNYLWAVRLGDLNGEHLSTELRARLARAAEFLYSIQDETTGRAPFYGHNDGALILPLSECEFHDVRPVIQAIHYLTTGERRYHSGPWDEDLVWLFGMDALQTAWTPLERGDSAAPDGGCYTVRSHDSFAFIRCPSFHDRPAQADALHVDLWWRGKNIAIDAGTYSYNAAPPWDNGLAGTAVHNSVTVDGSDQMERRGRFLWLPWLQSEVHAHTRSSAGSLGYWEGSHSGYGRLRVPVLHRRAVAQLGAEHWLVLDRLQSAGDHRYRLHWLFADMPHHWDAGTRTLRLETPHGPYNVTLGCLESPLDAQTVCSSASNTTGWSAPYYMYREPAVSLAAECTGRTITLWTLLGPGGQVLVDEGNLVVGLAGGSCRVQLNQDARERLVQRMVLSGIVSDELEP